MIIAFPVGAYTGGRLGDGPKDYGSSPARPRAYRIFEPAAAKIDHPTMQGILSRWDSLMFICKLFSRGFSFALDDEAMREADAHSRRQGI